MKQLIDFIFLPILLILLQVLVLNQMHIGWYATPFLYVWLILRLPNELSRGWLITLGFLCGFCVDLFCNTPGMHSFALATLAFLKAPILYLYVGREDFKTGVCTIRTMGIALYLRFMITATLAFVTMLYVVESFSFFASRILFMKILMSTLTTSLLIFGIESLKPKSR